MIVVTSDYQIFFSNMNFQFETARTKEKDLQTYKEAFDYYDWNKSGSISVKV